MPPCGSLRIYKYINDLHVPVTMCIMIGKFSVAHEAQSVGRSEEYRLEKPVSRVLRSVSHIYIYIYIYIYREREREIVTK
jgi:hypothetical protein